VSSYTLYVMNKTIKTIWTRKSITVTYLLLDPTILQVVLHN